MFAEAPPTNNFLLLGVGDVNSADPAHARVAVELVMSVSGSSDGGVGDGSEGSEASKILGECGYCGKMILQKERLLPMECMKCTNLYHVRCLRGAKPQVFLGDNLFRFTCSFCGSLGKEKWERPNLQWVHVTHLALYNLILNGRGGRKGFFRWNEDICGFIRNNWFALMPQRKKTQSWHSTVAGTLSVNCPSVFQSGTTLFGEHGWWSLSLLIPPNLKQALGTSIGGKRSSIPWDDTAPPHKKIKSSGESVKTHKVAPHKSLLSPVGVGLPIAMSIDSHVNKSVNASFLPLSEQQEKVLEKYLSQCKLAVHQNPKASRLLRKLKVRSKQRLYNHKVFDLDTTICQLLSLTTKYVVDKGKPYYEQVMPLIRPGSENCHLVTSNSAVNVASRLETVTSAETDALDHLSLIPVLSRALPPEFRTFRQFLCGPGDIRTLITSPYTTRKLKPFIFRTSELLPPKVKVNREIHEKFSSISDSPNQPQNIDFCYFQEHHLSAVNNLVSHFFWPVELSECLQYPDFTCVVLYGKLVVGCGFMTPDVKVNEAYISFLLVHPDFQRCCIGKIILYHLIQSCMGKDVTLHVSVDNPAMILYQHMGFKAERYCLDFYRHYYPEGHHFSKNAYFMRLKK